MRILQLAESYPPVIGGAERHVQTLSRELGRRGHQVTVLALGQQGVHNDDGVRVEHVPGWQRHLKPFRQDLSHEFHPPAADPGVVAALRRIVRELQPDVVHGRGWIFYSYASARQPGWPPLVVTLHDYGLGCIKKTNLFDDGDCAGPRAAKCLRCATGQYGAATAALLVVGRSANRHLLARVEQFIAVSSSVAAAARIVLPAEAEVEVIRSFVPTDLPETDTLMTGSKPSVRQPRGLMFVGTLGRHKGLDVLLAAHRQMRNRVPLRVVVAGPGADPPPQEGLTVFRDCEHGEVMRAWREAAIAVVPSRWAEPFGQVAVEAMAVGLPVVASALGGLADAIVHGVTGLLVPGGHVAALTSALDELVDDPIRARSMGAAGRARAAEFTVGAVVPQIESVYESVLGRPRIKN